MSQQRYNLRERKVKCRDLISEDEDDEDDEYKTVEMEIVCQPEQPFKKNLKPKRKRVDSSSDEDEKSEDEDVPERKRRKRDEDEESEEDFILDLNPLKNYLTDSLGKEIKKQKSLESLRKREVLDPIIEKILSKAEENLISDFCGAEPADKKWKVGLDKKKIDNLDPILQQIRKDLKDERPTMEKVLAAEIAMDDKKKAVQLMDRLSNEEPFTEDYDDLCSQINKILKSKVTEEEKKIRNLAKDLESMQTKILNLVCSEKIKAIIYNKYLKLKDLDSNDSEYGTLQEWLNWAISLPYEKATEHKEVNLDGTPATLDTDMKIQLYLEDVRKRLDERLYGMKPVKDALIEILNNRISKGGTKGCLIALKGIAGSGKTEVAKAIADVVGMPFERISLGGAEDPSILKGTNKSWLGSSPSIILQIMARMGVCDGMIQLDEIDKLSESAKAKEVQYALLHVTDYATNNEFRDNFLSEIPHDFSKLWILVAMNDDKNVDPILLDRLDVIEVPKYTRQDRIEILRRFILTKALANVGLAKDSVTLSDDAVNHILNMCNEEGGMRQMEKLIRTIVRKINLKRRYKPGCIPLHLSGNQCSEFLKDSKQDQVWKGMFN